jgi:hypothetical protein
VCPNGAEAHTEAVIHKTITPNNPSADVPPLRPLPLLNPVAAAGSTSCVGTRIDRWDMYTRRHHPDGWVS